MKNLQVVCMANVLIWMSAIESDSMLPVIIAIVSAVGGLVVDVVKKEKARLARQRKIVQKYKKTYN